MGMMIICAPRYLVVDGVVGPQILPTQSIVTGCPQATSFTRGLLHKMLHDLSHKIPRWPTKQYIDDLAQVVTDKEEVVVYNGIIQSATIIGTHCADLLLNISIKSVIVPDNYTARRASATLAKRGIFIRAANHAEDLGLGCAGCTRRTASTAAKRIAKAAKRSARVKMFARFNTKARKLYVTGVHPQQSYGLAGVGASDSLLKGMRRNLAACLGPHPKFACTRSLAAFVAPTWLDPEVWAAVDQVGWWYDLWLDSGPEARDDITSAWYIALNKFASCPKKHRANLVRGPLTSTIRTALSLGWHPIRPANWWTAAEGGKEVTFGSLPYTRFALLELVKQQAVCSLWRSASLHYRGGGLELGPPLVSLVRQVSTWLGKNGYPEAARCTPIVAAGGSNTSDRFGGPVDLEPVVGIHACHRCGSWDGALHRFWDCDHLADHADPLITRTNHLTDRVLRNAPDEKCLWYRGLVPYPMHNILPPPSVPRRVPRPDQA